MFSWVSTNCILKRGSFLLSYIYITISLHLHSSPWWSFPFSQCNLSLILSQERNTLNSSLHPPWTQRQSPRYSLLCTLPLSKYTTPTAPHASVECVLVQWTCTGASLSVHLSFTFGFILGVVYSIDFDTCKMTRGHHCSISQNSFTALKVLCALPPHPSIPLNPEKPLIFSLFSEFAFFRMVT